MQIELNKDELAVVLDALAAMPLARSYNVFNKLAPLMNPQQPQTGIRMPPLPETPPDPGGPQHT